MPSAAAPTGIRFEHLDAPVLGIGPRRPRLSWRVPDAGAGHRQRAYEIALGERTFVVESAEQVLVPWPGEPLAARERVEVPVRVRDDEWSPWSEPATVEAGPSPDDWTARLVSPRTDLRATAGKPVPVDVLDVDTGRLVAPDGHRSGSPANSRPSRSPRPPPAPRSSTSGRTSSAGSGCACAPRPTDEQHRHQRQEQQPGVAADHGEPRARLIDAPLRLPTR